MSVSQASMVPPASRYRPTSKHTSYHGPTSSAFSLDVAKNTLQNMGYQGGTDTQDATPLDSPPPSSLPRKGPGNPCKDPIWAIDKEEMIRLCHVYEEEMGLMYPIIDIEKLIIHGTNLYNFIEAAFRTGLAPNSSTESGIRDEQSIVLKMVLACATVVEGNGQSEIGYLIFENVREIADRKLHSEVIGVKDLPFLVLVVSCSIFLIRYMQKKTLYSLIGPVRVGKRPRLQRHRGGELLHGYTIP